MILDVDSKGYFTISAHPADAGVIKRSVPGVRWSSARRLWYCRPSRMAKVALSKLEGLGMRDDVRELLVTTGVAPPRPFPAHYRFRTEPYKHQTLGTAHLYGRPAAAMFAEPGTGKTKMAIDALAALWLEDAVQMVLVVCPLSVRNTWRDQFAQHCPVPHCARLVDAKFDAASITPDGKLQVVIVGCESLSAGRAFERVADVYTLGMRVALVVDEAHMVKNYLARRTQRVCTLARESVVRWVLTGTPVANSLGDLYSQFNILDEDIIGLPSYQTFLDRYAIHGGWEQRQIIGWQNTHEILEAIAPYTFRARKADCLDLPPKVYLRREVQMRPEQEKAYKELRRTGETGDTSTQGQLDLALRLHQVAGGYLPGPDGALTPFGKTRPPKIEELMNILDDCGDESVLIWCAYRHEVAAVAAAIEDWLPGDVVQIHGGVSEADRARNVDYIQRRLKRYLVGTAASGGVGLTLTAATVTVYYSNTFKYVERVQSEDRNHRIGQANTVTVYDLVSPGTIDEHIEKALAAKQDLASWVAAGGRVS